MDSEWSSDFWDFQTPLSEDTVGFSASVGLPTSEPKRKRRAYERVSKKTNSDRISSRNAARERSRVRNLRNAFLSLQMSLPSVPPDTKLSKLDVLVLASAHISHLRKILDTPQNEYQLPSNASEESLLIHAEESVPNSTTSKNNYLHPVKKWPIRSRLYAGVSTNSL